MGLPFSPMESKGTVAELKARGDTRSHGPAWGAPQTSITSGRAFWQAPGGFGHQGKLFHPKASFLSFSSKITGQLLVCLAFMEASISKLRLGRGFSNSSRIGLRLLLSFLL